MFTEWLCLRKNHRNVTYSLELSAILYQNFSIWRTNKYIGSLSLFFFVSFNSISSVMTLPFSVNSTFSQHPCPWHLWERNPQIPLGLHHWSKFSGAGEGLGRKQEVSGLLATLLPGAKTGVHLETENNRTKLTFTIPLLQLFCVDILTQHHLGISLSRTAI